MKYGKSQKQLDAGHVSAQSKGSDGTITVSIRLVCGGQHTVIFKEGQKEISKHTFSFSVKGCPKRGNRVKQGPDNEMGEEFEGTVHDVQTHYKKQAYVHDPYYSQGYYHQGTGTADGYSIYVQKTSALPVMTYKWGQGGIYEVELA